jgi:hypothetical protein
VRVIEYTVSTASEPGGNEGTRNLSRYSAHPSDLLDPGEYSALDLTLGPAPTMFLLNVLAPDRPVRGSSGKT